MRYREGAGGRHQVPGGVAAGREDGSGEVTRAEEVITSALLDRIDRGTTGPGDRVPPLAMAAVTGNAIDLGALRYALGQLVAEGALRLESGRGYYLRSAAVLAGHAKAGDR